MGPSRFVVAVLILAIGATAWNALDATLSYRAMQRANAQAQAKYTLDLDLAKAQANSINYGHLQREYEHVKAAQVHVNDINKQLDAVKARESSEVGMQSLLDTQKEMYLEYTVLAEAETAEQEAVSVYNADNGAAANAQNNLEQVQGNPPAHLAWTAWIHYTKVQIAIIAIAAAILAIVVPLTRTRTITP